MLVFFIDILLRNSSVIRHEHLGKQSIKLIIFLKYACRHFKNKVFVFVFSDLGLFMVQLPEMP
jgi:hypothetical protein